MAVTLGNVGWWEPDNEYSSRPDKVVLPTSKGTTLVIVVEPNDAQAPNGFGDQSNTDQFKIWEVDSSFSNATLVTTVTIAADLDKVYDKISADLFEDDSIGITYLASDQTIRYRKVNYGTWTAAGQETIASPALSDKVVSLDISISEADVPVVSWNQKADTNPKLVLRAAVRRTSDSTWVVTTLDDVITTADPNGSMISISSLQVKGGSAASRPYVAAVCSATDTGTDKGSRIYSAVVNEATGAIVNLTLRQSYLAGNMTTKWGTFPRRSYLFRSGDNEVTIVHMEAADKKKMLVARCTWDGNSWNEIIPPQMSTASAPKGLDPTGRFAASYANDRVNFYYVAPVSGVLSIFNYVAFIDRASSSVRYGGPFKWDNLNNNKDAYFPMAGTGKHANTVTNQFMMYFTKGDNNGGFIAKAHDVKSAPAPTEVTPGDGTTALTGTPQLSMKATLGKQWPQSRHKAIWQFALDPGFTTSLKTYVQDDSKFITIENTQDPGSYVYISDTLPADLALTSGNWFVRGALIDEFGIQGDWSSAGNIGLSHPPMAKDLLPNSGSFVASGNVTFSWTFTDPLATDSQTAYQIVAERNDDGTVVYDSGKVDEINAGHIAAITQTGVLLRWKIQVWDTDDISGGYSNYATFGVAGPPSVVIDTPAPGGVVASGTPAVLFTPTVDGARRIKAYQVVIKQAGQVVKNSGTVAVDVASGTQLMWRSYPPLLENNATFEVQVFVTDETVITSGSDVVSFVVNQNTPAAPGSLTVDENSYNVDGEGYVLLSWSQASIDPDFVAWVISRKDDLIDGLAQVVEEGAYEEIAQVATGTFKDYYAPSGYKSNYKVEQLVNRNGDLAVSESNVEVAAYPMSEGYWIIQPSSDPNADAVTFRISNVTEDSYSPEWEETEYTIIGRGRHIDKGDYLGVKGSITAKLRDTIDSTARKKKLQLEAARDTDSAVYLRNPFGDVWFVSVGNLGISRIAGVGRSEFVDVEIPYSEVSE